MKTHSLNLVLTNHVAIFKCSNHALEQLAHDFDGQQAVLRVHEKKNYIFHVLLVLPTLASCLYIYTAKEKKLRTLDLNFFFKM